MGKALWAKGWKELPAGTGPQLVGFVGYCTLLEEQWQALKS